MQLYKNQVFRSYKLFYPQMKAEIVITKNVEEFKASDSRTDLVNAIHFNYKNNILIFPTSLNFVKDHLHPR